MATKKKKTAKKSQKQIRAAAAESGKSAQQLNAINRVRATFTGSRVLDRSVHKTNIWLKEIMSELNWNNRERAYSALRATLQSVRDVLLLEETVQLSAQLPLILRGVYFEGWRPQEEPVRVKTIDEFHELVRSKLGYGWTKFTGKDIQNLTRACLQVMSRHISEGEMREVQAALSLNVKELIPVAKKASRKRAS